MRRALTSQVLATAGKNAPKKVNDGAPPAEQAVKEIQPRDSNARVAFTLRHQTSTPYSFFEVRRTGYTNYFLC
jgi:hypothetical protein